MLPDAAQQAFIRAPQRSAMGPLGMALCTLALWAGTWALWQQPLPGSLPAPEPLKLTRSLAKPKLVLALDVPTALAAQPLHGRQAMVVADMENLVGHVARALLQDQFDSLILKVSLGQQVVNHLRQDLASQP